MKISMTSKQRKVYREVTPQFENWTLAHGVAWRDILRIRKVVKADGPTAFALTPAWPVIDPQLVAKAQARLELIILASADPGLLAEAVATLVEGGYILTLAGWGQFDRTLEAELVEESAEAK